MKARLRPTAWITAIMLATGALSAPLAMSAADAAGLPTLTASASTALKGGQTITLSATGLDPNATASILQCSGTTGPGDCDTTNIGVAQTDADGAFSNVSFTVKSGQVGAGFCPGKTAGSSCMLVAATNLTTPAVLPITFAPIVSVTPSTGLKAGDTVEVSGYGYPANKSLVALECANPPSASSCAFGTAAMGTTTADGTFSGVKVKVTTGNISSTGTCDSSNPCLIVASTDTSGTDPMQSGAAPITFAEIPPASTPTKAATAISLTAKVKGTRTQKVNVHGVITSAGVGVRGLTVDLFQRIKLKGSKKWGKWKQIASMPSGKAGAFKMKGLKKTKRPQQFRAKHASQVLGDHEYLASRSKAVRAR